MSRREARPSARHYLAVFLLSAATLAFEIVLLRVFGYSQWHHFASLAVSLALLGFGAAGTLLALLGARAVRAGDSLFAWSLVGAGGGVLLLFLLNQRVHVRPLFAVWDNRELFRLLVLNFAAFVPLFFAAIPIGQMFMRWPESTRRLYAANLLGAGVGAGGASLLLTWFFLPHCLFLISGLFLMSATLFARIKRGHGIWAGWTGAAGVLVLLVVAVTPLSVPDLHISDFKRLAMLTDLPDAQVLERRPGLRGTATVVRSDSIRSAWGLSLQWQQPAPPVDMLVIDTDRAIPIPREDADIEDFAYLEATLGAAPYAIATTESIAVLGTSEAFGVMQALRHADHVAWVEQSPAIGDIMGARLQGRVNLAVMGARPDIAKRVKVGYSLFVVDQALGSGDSLGEEPLLTAQGIATMLDRLRDEGMIAIPFHLENPPRHFQRLMATIRDGLRESGRTQPAQHVLAMRSLQDAMVIVTARPATAEQVEAWRKFADRWGFDLVWYPGMTEEEANRIHQLSEPVYYRIAAAALEGRGDLPPLAAMYEDSAATDLRPYFWYSMQWRMLPELSGQLGRQGLVYLDWGALMLAVSMLAAALLAVVLILLPLGKLPRAAGRATRPTIMLFFAGIGLGYLVLEMAAFQRAVLLLGEPVLAASLVFGTFLVGSGLGSLTAPSEPTAFSHRVIFRAIGGGLLIAALVLGPVGLWFWSATLVSRAAVVLVGVLPLAFALGRAMPWGLRQVAGERAIAWAWGINGFASVIAAPLASFLSAESGHPATLLAGVACYGVAAGAGWLWVRRARAEVPA